MGPRVTILNSGTVYTDKRKLASFFLFLLGVSLLSALIGYVASGKLLMTLQYAGVNLLVGIIFGPSIFLLRQRGTNERRDG